MTGKVARANVAIYIDGDSIWIETGGKLRVYGRRRFRDAGRTGRGEETRVATLPKISGRVLTLSGCARKTGPVIPPTRILSIVEPSHVITQSEG